MGEQRLFSKIVRGFSRDQDLTMAAKLQKGVKLVRETASAKIQLRSCGVGAGARVVGRMRVANGGVVVAGQGLTIISSFVPVEIVTGTSGRVELGDHVWINFGTVIAAKTSVIIGNRVMIGQHCIVSDVDVPEAVDDPETTSQPIVIGDDAWIAGRVTLRPGVKIGKGAVITAGSVVESDIPDGVVAAGIPARIVRDATLSDAATENGVGSSASPFAEAVPEAPTQPPRFSGTIVSDFTIDELADELRLAGDHPALGVRVAPFGQVTQTLLQPDASSESDFLVVWTRPESLPAFARTIAFTDVEDAELVADVDSFCSLVEQAASRYKAVFVATWSLAPWMRGLGMLDGRKGGGMHHLLTANLRLCHNLASTPNVFVLSAERWLLAGGGQSNPRAWYLGKMAASRGVMAEAAADIKAAMAAFDGGARKLLVLDLDDTLWGGIVGDVGWEGVRLGGHDGVGEAFVDFQRAIKNLKRRGVVLAIVSKNEESVALEAIRRHPEMVLREDDFVGWRINWTDKAQNILELASELNLGLQSVVFIDDNPVERARVREALPEVFVPEWPADKMLYPSAFARLRCFDAPAISREDLERTRMYAEERKRGQLQKQVGSMADWLKSLDLKVRVEPLGAANLSRAAQLLNKTNQLNLTTRRLTEAELSAWVRENGRSCWTVSVSDRFGDAGLTGLLSIEQQGEVVRIVDYLLSCRVMGRKVEETMVHLAVEAARKQAATAVVAEYLPTAKNKPCLTFLLGSGFTNSQDREFRWLTSEAYPLPDPIHLEWQR